MSRKHYIEVAEIIRSHADGLGSTREDDASAETLASVTRELALMFKRDNAAFNAGKFFEAAGFPELTGTRMGLN